MKTLLSALLLTTAGLSSAGVILPKAPDRNRYAETLAASPFILETKVTEEKAVEKVSPFKDLFVRGIGKADGKDFVLVQRLGEERAMRFFGGEPGEDSIVVKSVKIGETFHDTKVTLEKGSETGEIGFKEEAINAPPQALQARPQATFGNQVRPATPGTIVKPGSSQINPAVPRPQFTPGLQLPKPPGSGNVTPANGRGNSVRPPEPTRRIRTPIINN
jgi:hypothetical protein